MKLKKEQLVGANYHYTRYTLEYFIRSMQKMGLHRMEFYAADPHLFVLDCPPDRIRAIKKMLTDAQMEVVCFTPENCVYPINIGLEDDFVRERSVRYYERTLEIAAEMESPLVQIVGGRGYFDGDLSGAWGRSADSLRRIAKKAEQYGITMVLEASSYNTSTVINTCTHIDRMLRELDLGNVKAMIDTNAVYMAKEDFEQVVSLLGDRMVHMHFIDAKPGAYCLVPGDGEMPLGKYIEILARHGYQGVLTPELWGTQYVANPDDALRRYLEFCAPYTD